MARIVALRIADLPPRFERVMATHAFFAPLGLAGAFVLVAAYDLASPLPATEPAS